MQHGLVHALLLDGQGGARQVDWPEVEAWRADQGVLWLHFDYTMPQTREWLLLHSGLPEAAVEALLTLETRPRVTTLADAHLINLRGVNLTPGAQPEDMIAIRLWLDSSRIISTQRRSLKAVSDLLEALQNGMGPESAQALLAELLDRLTWHFEDVIASVEERVSQLEEVSASSQGSAALGGIAELRRQAISLRRYLSPQREAMARLLADTGGWLSESDRLVIREAADRLQRLLEDIDLAREHATIAQEDLQSRLSDRLGRRMYVLAVITCLFLPLTFITGLFGVNLGGIPGAQDDFGFTAFFLLTLGFGLVLTLLLRWRHWL
ncbi:zinc transporter ZntB [Alcanivorax sp. 1008]|uniref:zinc transporter ZntB n=1 Tax=Alcanivorax sp. 1008 TaxID=2816853 RepID=UPI001DC203CF|nr:zinc transporter ZntB [Alcanivorax sp. 1008]MCC1496411.1 zinc transporter ZntB [Alcanivorax sp. 1008]